MKSNSVGAQKTTKALIFDNHWMTLHAKSAGQLHRVICLQNRNAAVEKSFAVTGELAGRLALSRVQANHPCGISSESTTGFFVRVDGDYFALHLATKDRAEANDYMGNHDNVGLIATDNEGFHYIAELSAAS